MRGCRHGRQDLTTKGTILQRCRESPKFHRLRSRQQHPFGNGIHWRHLADPKKLPIRRRPDNVQQRTAHLPARRREACQFATADASVPDFRSRPVTAFGVFVPVTHDMCHFG